MIQTIPVLDHFNKQLDAYARGLVAESLQAVQEWTDTPYCRADHDGLILRSIAEDVDAMLAATEPAQMFLLTEDLLTFGATPHGYALGYVALKVRIGLEAMNN